MNPRPAIRPNWDALTPAEQAAWHLILSWARRGILGQQAYLQQHTN